MPLDDETEAKIDELADELYEAHVEDQTIRFWEGGIVRSVPTGAPPEYITIEIEGIYDENVMWRGIPASLVVGDEVLVWENPITHRREVWGGSGASTTSTLSPWQKITVAPFGADFTLPSAAIAWINALAAPIAPSATRLFAINMLGGTFVEAAAVTIPRWVGVNGEGEETVLDMGDAELILSPDSSLENIVVKSTADDNWYVILITAADNVVMRDVRVIVTGSSGNQMCVDIYDSHNVELYHVICESTQTTNWGFYIYWSTVLLWDCKADDTTNFEEPLYIRSAGLPSTVTTKFCEFRAAGAGNDVTLDAACTWNHFACQFDPDNCTLTGTEVPLTHGKTNFDDIVTFEDGFTMDGVSGANVVTFPDNVANAMHFVDDTTGINFQQFVTTAGAQATVFNVGEADVDFNVRASAGISDPTDAFFVEGSTGRIFMGDIAPTYVGHLTVADLAVNTTASYRGAALHHVKTAGVTDHLDTMYGLDCIMQLNQVGGVVGFLYGLRFEAEITAGDIGTVVNNRDIGGIWGSTDLRGGTVHGDARGIGGYVGQQAANTVTGDLFAGHLEISLGGTVTGTVYMHFLQEDGNADFGYYQTTSAGVAGANYLEGKLTLASAELEFTAATGLNLIEFPDALANALYFADDTTAINFQQFVTTAAGQATVFNIGEADVDFRVAASGVTNAIRVDGATGDVYMDQDLDVDGMAAFGNATAVSATTIIRAIHAETVADNANRVGMTLAYRVAKTAAVYTGSVRGFYGGPAVGAANTQNWTSAYGLVGAYAVPEITAGATGTITAMHGFVSLPINNAAGVTVSSVYGLHVQNPINAGTMTTVFGIYIANQTRGATNYSIYSGGGRSYHVGTLAVGGTNSVAAQLYVDQSLVGGAIPVALFDQADLSEEFFEFTTTVGAGNPIDTAALGAYYGKARVMVTGVGYKVLALYEES